jgi:hypothetical protein
MLGGPRPGADSESCTQERAAVAAVTGLSAARNELDFVAVASDCCSFVNPF